MKCNLILAGFAKCGTSSLHEYLNLHPKISMSTKKEPHFFSKTKIWERGVDWHDSLFSQDKTEAVFFGESSTSYSVWEPALLRIKKYIPDAKIVLLLRHPVERLLSHYRWMYAEGNENLILEKALKLEEKSTVSPDVHRNGCYPWYLRTSRYSYFVPYVRGLFGENNVLTLSSDLLSSERQQAIDQCCSFLEIEPIDLKDIEIFNNRTLKTISRNWRLPDRINQLIPRSVRVALSPVKRSSLKALRLDQREVPEISQSTIVELNSILAEEVSFYKMEFDRTDSTSLRSI